VTRGKGGGLPSQPNGKKKKKTFYLKEGKKTIATQKRPLVLFQGKGTINFTGRLLQKSRPFRKKGRRPFNLQLERYGEKNQLGLQEKTEINKRKEKRVLLVPCIDPGRSAG